MMATIAEHILTLPAWVALSVVFALPALESSAFVGFKNHTRSTVQELRTGRLNPTAGCF